ncbi:MAG: hypothetical protein ACREVG_17980, partial [Burkholderiales bacterium]
MRAGAGRDTVAPETLEWLFTVAAIAFLIWQADAFREPDFIRGAGDRYQRAVELKVPIAPQASATGRFADAISKSPLDPAAIERLTTAYEVLARGLALPLTAKLPRLEELENRAREARAETDVHG